MSLLNLHKFDVINCVIGHLLGLLFRHVLLTNFETIISDEKPAKTNDSNNAATHF